MSSLRSIEHVWSIRIRISVIITIAVCMVLYAAPLFAFSCGNRIVSVGDGRSEVMMKCGEPSWKESREEEVLERLDEGFKRRSILTIEEWTYNLGPQALIRILEFRNGKLTDIRTGGYGYADAGGIPDRCDEHAFSVGDRKLDVLMRCGEPSWKDQHTEEIIDKLDSSSKLKKTVQVEEWTYNLGPNKLMRIITFRNGQVSEIRTGDYGR